MSGDAERIAAGVWLGRPCDAGCEWPHGKDTGGHSEHCGGSLSRIINARVKDSQ